MKSVIVLRRGGTSLVLAALLAACGGGGGGGLITVTAANAELLGGSIGGAGGFVADLEDLVENFAEVIESGLSGTVDCDFGGTATLTINDSAPALELSTGDRMTFRFTRCVLDLDGETATFSGTLVITATRVTRRSPTDYDIVLSVSFQNLSFELAGTTFTVSGGFTADTTTPDDVNFTRIVTGSSLRVIIREGTTTFTASLSNFRQEETFDESTGDYTVSFRGRVFDSDAGGSFDVETTTPFMGTDPDDPDSGEYLITGANGSTLRLVALDNVNVRIFVDADGDGTEETTIDTTWAALDA